MSTIGALYDRHVLPRLIGCACCSKPIMKQREKVVPLAEGAVLELGVGAGANLRYYDPARVSRVTGIDPSAELRAVAASAARPQGLVVAIEDGVAEALPFAAGAFDTVVCTFTLCSVRSVAETLEEARRVLRPGGRLLFSEHGLSPDAGVARWQGRLEPVWKRLAGGCHLTRPIAAAIAASGFRLAWKDQMYLPGAPRIAGWTEWGAAQPA